MSEFFSHHAVHAAIIAIPLLTVIWMLGPEILGRRRNVHGDQRTGRGVALDVGIVAAATFGAGALHGVVTHHHFDEATLYGVFFVVAAALQIGYAVVLLARPSRHLLALGALGNLAVAGLWAWTRVVSIPLGPEVGEREAVGTVDIVCTTLELVAVVAAVAAIRRLSRHAPLSRALPPLPVQRRHHSAAVGSMGTIAVSNIGSNVRLVTKD